jgi:hypothetical protein
VKTASSFSRHKMISGALPLGEWLASEDRRHAANNG